MKKLTIVIQITDTRDDHGEPALDHSAMEREISAALDGQFDIYSSYQIMEIIEAPYGPQHPNGVFVDTRHATGKCVCRPGSKYVAPTCKAKVHR